MPAVVVVGDLLTDVLVRAGAPRTHASDAPAAVSVHGGGSAANVAWWLARAGLRVALVARVGHDAYGSAAVDDLTRAGVQVHASVDETVATGSCAVLLHDDGERDFLVDPGASARLSVTDLPDDLFRAGRHLHVSGYPILHEGSRAAALAALDRARTAGMTTSLDPASAGPLSVLGAVTFLDLVGAVDVLLPNADEVLALTGESDPAVGAAQLSAHAAEVVVTLGAAGALWYGDGRVVRASAVRVEAPESTGAGDAFSAGFLLARVVRRTGPADALRAGCDLAAQAVSQCGARP